MENYMVGYLDTIVTKKPTLEVGNSDNKTKTYLI